MRGKVYILSAFEKGLSTVLLSLGSLIVAYLIGSEDYGKFGILFSAYLFSSLINDSGIATSILNFSLEYTSQRATQLRKFNNSNNIISLLLFLLITSYYVVTNFSLSWIISVLLLAIALRIHSKTIIPHSILIKKNRYKELNRLTFLSSIGALIIAVLLSQLITDFTLASFYVLSLVALKYILLYITEHGSFNSISDFAHTELAELKDYSSWIFKISLTNQAFLVLIDFILSKTISFELLGKYKLDLFLVNTLIFVIGSSIERIWIANYSSYSEIPRSYKVNLVVLLYVLLFISIPIHFGVSAIINFSGKADMVLSAEDFFLVLSCYVSVPLQQLLLFRAKKTKEFIKPYFFVLVIIRLLTLMVFLGLVLSIGLNFNIYLYGYATGSLLLFLIPMYFVKYGLSNK